MICHDKKVIYIHPCRCAGTSIEIRFGFSSDVLNNNGERHALPEFYPAKFWKSYSSYISVRNPWDRFLSAFALIRQANLPAYKVVTDNYDFSNFNEFVRDFNEQKHLYEEDRMFWPQSRWFYLKGKRVKYSKVIRFESLETDIRKVLLKHGMDAQTLPHELKTDRPHFKDIYDGKSIEIIGDMYRKDIELLRYKF